VQIVEEVLMRRLFLVILAIAGYALYAFGQIKPVSALDARVDVKAGSSATLPTAANVPALGATASGVPASDYVVGPGDKLSVIVMELQDDASFNEQAFTVNISGDVSLPYAGRVRAVGLTTHDIEREITTNLAKIIKDPQVVVNIAEYHSQPVSVLGAVNTGGEYQIQGQKRLLQALSLAGGFTEDVGNSITLTRDLQWGRIPLPNAHDDPTGQFSVASISVKDVLHSAKPEENIQMMAGDIISVSKAEIVYVVGSVKMPGGFPMGQDETLSTLQVLSLAQGTTPTAGLEKAQIIRLVPGSKARTQLAINLKQLLQGRVPDVQLQPGDILFVPNSKLRTAGQTTVQAIVNAATGAAIYGSRM
jgi:polysaccharide export outer membrane protein